MAPRAGIFCFVPGPDRAPPTFAFTQANQGGDSSCRWKLAGFRVTTRGGRGVLEIVLGKFWTNQGSRAREKSMDDASTALIDVDCCGSQEGKMRL